MEKQIELTTKDGHVIYGTHTQANKASDTILIFVHGLSGNQQEHHYFNAAPYFEKVGYDSLRFDLYSKKEKGRQLSECSVATHVEDLRMMINHVKGDYKNVILVGHSMGTVAILNSDLSDIAGLVLWDPTSGFSSLAEKNAEYSEELNKYILHWGLDILINKEMMEDWKKANDRSYLTSKITKPCKFVFAGKQKNYENWKPYLKDISVEYEFAVIDKATHEFYEEGTEERLFNETLVWLNNQKF